MIQRIQSVYLFLVFCLLAVLVFFPIAVSPIYAGDLGFYSGYFGACAVFALVTIFIYKNRKRQISMCYGMITAQVLIYVFFFIIFYWKYHFPLSEFYQHASFTFVFPFIAIILLFLAIRAIRKDEKLVRSLDRLR